MLIKVTVEVKTAFGREYTTVDLDEDDIRSLAEDKAGERYACVERAHATEVKMTVDA